MIDKYTYFNDLQISDFYYILHCLHNSNVITINDDNKLDIELLEILKEYKEIN